MIADAINKNVYLCSGLAATYTRTLKANKARQVGTALVLIVIKDTSSCQRR